MLRHLVLPLLISLSVTSCTTSKQSAHDPMPASTEPGRVSFADGKVSFAPPSGFRPLTAEEINRKFPGRDAPHYVFADESQSVSVGIKVTPSRVSRDNLDQLKGSLEETLPRMVPGLQWQDRTIVEIGGTRWINLRFTSYALDADIVNDMYVTPFEGNLVIFSYNAVVDRWERERQLIDASKSSIRVGS